MGMIVARAWCTAAIPDHQPWRWSTVALRIGFGWTALKPDPSILSINQRGIPQWSTWTHFHLHLSWRLGQGGMHKAALEKGTACKLQAEMLCAPPFASTT